MPSLRPATALRALGQAPKASLRTYATATPPKAPRHLLSIADLTASEFATVVRTAGATKQLIKSSDLSQLRSMQGMLAGQTIAIMFSKRSTRTRVSMEGAIAMLGGHPMFLGRDDIQLGVNESLLDTSKVISSMCSAMVARVGPHSDVTGLAEHSSCPVINALSDTYHPLQTLADFLTLHEAYPASAASSITPGQPGLGLDGLRIAWVGDANNILYDLSLGAAKAGVQVVAATPKGYEIPAEIIKQVEEAAMTSPTPGGLSTTHVPEEALKGADVVVTDTWISMGQESEKQARLKAFEGYQVTEALAKRGGAKENWKFMHCLPRKPEEVDDEVFYGPRSLVFPEAENRLWSATAALQAFVVNKGVI